jgi:hypothetical protein
MTLRTKLTAIGAAAALAACTPALEPPAADAPPELPAATPATAGESEASTSVELPDCRVSSPPVVAC